MHTDDFWKDLFHKVEKASANGMPKISVLREAGVMGNAFHYHCRRLNLIAKSIKGKMKQRPSARFIRLQAPDESKTIELNMKIGDFHGVLKLNNLRELMDFLILLKNSNLGGTIHE